MNDDVKAFEDEKGRVLMCFHDKLGNWHIEYFHDMRTCNTYTNSPTLFYVNEWEVTADQFLTILEAMNNLAGGVLPIPECLREEA